VSVSHIPSKKKVINVSFSKGYNYERECIKHSNVFTSFVKVKKSRLPVDAAPREKKKVN